MKVQIRLGFVTSNQVDHLIPTLDIEEVASSQVLARVEFDLEQFAVLMHGGYATAETTRIVSPAEAHRLGKKAHVHQEVIPDEHFRPLPYSEHSDFAKEYLATHLAEHPEYETGTVHHSQRGWVMTLRWWKDDDDTD